jgi:predicted N-formylglutamate amidohydrolase
MTPRSAFSAPFEVADGTRASAPLLICDHASNALPPHYGNLGLTETELTRHIAYDIGAAAVTRGLAEALGSTAVLGGFSRLLIDPNRGLDDPTLIMRLSDGAVVPANAHIGLDEVARRVEAYYDPYHGAVAAQIAQALEAGRVPSIVSMHSFTPRWKGVERPWHVAVLWDSDPRLPVPLIAALEAEGDLVVGNNRPYDGALKNDTLYRHATLRGLPHALIEIRQDLISTPEGVADWVARLTRLIPPLMAAPELAAIAHYGSRADRRLRAGDPT